MADQPAVAMVGQPFGCQVDAVDWTPSSYPLCPCFLNSLNGKIPPSKGKELVYAEKGEPFNIFMLSGGASGWSSLGGMGKLFKPTRMVVSTWQAVVTRFVVPADVVGLATSVGHGGLVQDLADHGSSSWGLPGHKKVSQKFPGPCVAIGSLAGSWLGHGTWPAKAKVPSRQPKPQVLDVGSQGDWWVSTPSVISVEAFDRILASALLRGVHCEAGLSLLRTRLGTTLILSLLQCRIGRGTSTSAMLATNGLVTPIVRLSRKLVDMPKLASSFGMSKSLYPPIFGVMGAEGPSRCVDGAPATEEVSLGGEHAPAMDDDVPLSQIARDMSSKFKGLAGGPLDEPSGHSRAKVVPTTYFGDATGSSLPPSPTGPAAAGHTMIDDPPLRMDRPSGRGA
uniref:Uncharacterized protein n=1 Tax=Cannabis sativa TaxID=3483 RepID=A0A803P4K2_CANSA